MVLAYGDASHTGQRFALANRDSVDKGEEGDVITQELSSVKAGSVA
jgi:hypothetical protein